MHFITYTWHLPFPCEVLTCWSACFRFVPTTEICTCFAIRSLPQGSISPIYFYILRSNTLFTCSLRIFFLFDAPDFSGCLLWSIDTLHYTLFFHNTMFVLSFHSHIIGFSSWHHCLFISRLHKWSFWKKQKLLVYFFIKIRKVYTFKNILWGKSLDSLMLKRSNSYFSLFKTLSEGNKTNFYWKKILNYYHDRDDVYYINTKWRDVSYIHRESERWSTD